uniref:Uncharacterized protein n=1 Tax=Rhizophora mucronata TaxID=61149 RepID=A0A2P2NF75_RHIMU
MPEDVFLFVILDMLERGILNKARLDIKTCRVISC